MSSVVPQHLSLLATIVYTSFDPATNTITFKTNHFSYYAIEEELPQTGNSDNYNAITGIAALMTVTGIAIIIKNRKENEE